MSNEDKRKFEIIKSILEDLKNLKIVKKKSRKLNVPLTIEEIQYIFLY